MTPHHQPEVGRAGGAGPGELRGPLVVLRHLRPADVADRQRLGVSAEVTRGFGTEHPRDRKMTREDARRWARTFERWPTPYKWVIEFKGRMVGEARLTLDDDGVAGRFAVAILDPALLGRGLGTEVGGLVLDYAFARLGLERVNLRVLAPNARAVGSYLKLGFEVVERIHRAAFVDGEWHDDLVMEVRASDAVATARPDERLKISPMSPHMP